MEFRTSIFAQFLPAAARTGPDAWIDAALSIFLESKAFALFALLFGVGLAIQHERLAPSGRRAVLLTRRMLALLAFGLIHMILIWNGDILTEYAIAGMLVLPLLYADALGLAVMAGLSLAVYLLLPLWAPLLPFPDAAGLARHVAQAAHTYGSGNYVQALDFRLRELALIVPLHVYVFPRTVALMLLGALVWKVGLLKSAERHSARLWPGAGALTMAGLVLTLATSGRPYSGWPRLGTVEVIGGPLAPILLALGYAAAVIALVDAGPRRRWLAWAEFMGRTAFTNYIVQSVVLVFIFYGYGLGLFGKLGLTRGMGVVLAIYGAQILASRLWLGRFRFGPMEWLWRALMYGSAPRLVRAKAQSAFRCNTG
jgi:uncharacterized protein